MGGFHCPLGAIAPKTEGCIGCGLCSASTKGEYASAADKLRAYLREHVQRSDRVRKIAVCGKGGVGKSSVSAIFARALADYGYKVLVLDTDESNPVLARNLGIEPPERTLTFSDGPLSPFPCTDWLKDSFRLCDIPAEYCSKSGSLMLAVAGKIEDPFQGCACTFSTLAREFTQNIILEDGEIVIADIEAGVESFGRGMERGVDTVIAVMEPSYDSLEVVKKIRYMAEGVGISRLRAVVNKVPDCEMTETVLEALQENNIKYLGTVMADASAPKRAFRGEIPSKEDRIYRETAELVRLLLDENEMDYPL